MPMPFTILHKVHISFAACIYTSILITCQVLEGLPHLLVFKQKTVLSYLHMLRTWYYLHLMLCTGVADPCCCSTSRAAIESYLFPTGPTAANPSHTAAWQIWQTDGWMDTVPFHRPCLQCFDAVGWAAIRASGP